jgi:hypothetical protein
MRLLKNVIFVIVLVYLLLLWRQHAANDKASPNAKASGTVTITFSSTEELIDKLRQVKTGQTVELEAGPPSVEVVMSPGIRCSDEAAKAAWMEQQNQLHEQQNQLQEEQNQIIRAELQRIHDGAPDSPLITWQ